MKHEIYCIWSGTNPMPPRRLECFKKLARTTRCKITLITPDTLDKWILPEHPLHPAYQYLSDVHKADYLRCYLMHFYGGGYTDIKLQGGPWNQAFDDMDKYGWMINGYPVSYVGHATPLCKDVWYNVLATNAIICKPNTPFTNRWYKNIIELLDKKLDELRKKPATHPYAQAADGLGYPLEYIEPNADVFQPITIEYADHVGRTLPEPNVDLNTYRF